MLQVLHFADSGLFQYPQLQFHQPLRHTSLLPCLSKTGPNGQAGFSFMAEKILMG